MKTNPNGYNLFSKRHMGPDDQETESMLHSLDLGSLDDLSRADSAFFNQARERAKPSRALERV